MVNSSTAWACASGKVIMPWSVRSTRKEAKQSIIKNWSKSWDVLKRGGITIVKIRMVPIK